MQFHRCLFLLSCLFAVLPFSFAVAQPELEPWGNLDGIRVDGQLMAFGSSVRVVFDGGIVLATAKERQDPHYAIEGADRVVRTNLDSLYITEQVQDAGRGMARVTVACTAHADMKTKGVFFTVGLPPGFAAARVAPADPNSLLLEGPRGQRLEIRMLQADGAPGLQDAERQPYPRVDIPIKKGGWRNGETMQRSFTISVSGDIDRRPVHVTLHTDSPGRAFAGIGGNFRIQNTRLDPQVIDYCLQHLRVAWGRVELPWRWWQPFGDVDPLADARSGHLSPAVVRAMEMAHTLGEKKIPFILSAWFPPEWAVVGPVSIQQPGPDHVWGNRLNHDRDTAIYRSITDYIVFLKERYGVEPKYFSFNESDLGINVRQTAQEHDALIKGMGAYFAAQGLGTRVLLGDNSDATTWSFIGAAMDDTAARRWMGAVSFHSWRGWDTTTLQHWADAATRLRLPLLVAEGSIDAAAWHYPAILREPSYALKEIGLYVRLLAICQPLSILQWQLTSDYSLLAGAGLFGDTGALRPTQRFWNLKQLSLTPAGLFAIPAGCDRPGISVAALGDNARREYVLHLVNDAAAREVVVDGLPKGVTGLRMFTTNQTKSAEEGRTVAVKGGQARFSAEARSFVTLIAR
ncbi:MAG TPA: hypothetical protein VHE54_14660 [Puia sp.]|nr:hypothetical protein [Puia sp.]